MEDYTITFEYWQTNIFKIGDIIDTGINEINEKDFPSSVEVECMLDKFKIDTIDEISNEDEFTIVVKGKCSFEF